jgi:hypothetical protein
MVSRGAPSRVELCVESLHPTGAVSRLEASVDRLRELEAAGHIDEFDLVVWGDRVGITSGVAGTDAAERVRERVNACMEWAEAHGRSLRPVVDVRETDNAFTGESHTAIDLPSMLLVEYEDETVSHVAPSSDGTSTRSVTDRLQALAAEAGSRTRASPGAPTSESDGPGDARDDRRLERRP